MKNHSQFPYDINLLEYPLYFVNDKNKGQNFKFEQIDGYKLISKYKPGKNDILVLYCILLKSKNQGWQDRVVTNFYDIARTCGFDSSGKSYERIKQSLNCWVSCSIYFDNSFYTKTKYETFNTNIFQHWQYDKQENKLEILFTEKFLQKVKESEFFKIIDFETIKKIRSPLAMRLYDVLSKSFYNSNTFIIDMHKLAAKLTLSEKYISKIEPRVTAAIKSINEDTSLNIEYEIEKTGKNKATVTFRKIPKRMASLMRKNPEQPPEPPREKPEYNPAERYEEVVKKYSAEKLTELQEKFYAEQVQGSPTISRRFNQNGFNDSMVQYLFTVFLGPEDTDEREEGGNSQD